MTSQQAQTQIDAISTHEVDTLNAALIVRAVNSHADMLAALSQILPRAISNQNDDLRECKRQMAHIEAIARAAIAKAEGR